MNTEYKFWTKTYVVGLSVAVRIRIPAKSINIGFKYE